MHDGVCFCDEASNHQLPIASAIFVILHLSTDKKHWLIFWPGEAYS